MQKVLIVEDEKAISGVLHSILSDELTNYEVLVAEDGLEALEVEGNKAWSAKPRVGVELKGALPLGMKKVWELKGALDFSYEYELAGLNERENARLTAIESDYHKLSKPEDENGRFRTKASLGIEIKDRYGVFLTGDYSVGNHSQDDYKAGVDLKVAF